MLMSSSEAKLITLRNSMRALKDSAALISAFSEVRFLAIGLVASLTKRLYPSSAASS